MWFKVFAGSFYCGLLSVRPTANTPELFLPVHGGRLVGKYAHDKIISYCQLQLVRQPRETLLFDCLPA